MKNKGISEIVSTVLLMTIAITAVSSAAIFLQGTMGDLQGSVTDWLSDKTEEEQSSLSIIAGRENPEGFLMVDLKNDGSRTLEFKKSLYRLYINNVPEEDWKAVGTVNNINPGSTIVINTSTEFPGSGDTKDIEIVGPSGTRAGIICGSGEC